MHFLACQTSPTSPYILFKEMAAARGAQLSSSKGKFHMSSQTLKVYIPTAYREIIYSCTGMTTKPSSRKVTLFVISVLAMISRANTACENPSPLINGKWTSYFMKQRLEVGARWEYSCYSGYSLVGSATVICNSNNQWSAAVPTCVRDTAVKTYNSQSITSKCSRPGQIINGRWTATFMRDELEVGAVWKFTCYNGYTLVGSESISCNANLQWTSDVPTCNRGTIYAPPVLPVDKIASSGCPYPRVIVNGKWISTFITNQLEIGAVWQYTCYAGYTLVGSASITCKPDGQWTSDVPKCEKGVPTGPIGPTSSPIVPSGSTSCSDMQLPAFTTGTYYYNIKPREIGTRLVLSCSSGYTLIGNSEITCQADGQWSGKLPQCVINPTSTSVSPPSTFYTCNDPGLPNNGQRFGQYTNYYLEIGAQIVFTCNDGFKMEGADTITCNLNGQWSPSVIPTCKRDLKLPPFVTTTSVPPVTSCSDPGIPENSQRFASYKTNYLEIGAIIFYSCNDGFLLKGADTITCNDRGKWSSSIPKCEIVKTTSAPVPPVYPAKITSCSDPGIPTNAQRTARYRKHFLEVGAVILYTCNNGFDMQGTDTITCNSDGKWSSPIPKCEDAKEIGCSLPPEPQNGRIQLIIPILYPMLLTKRFPGDKIQYICNYSYHLVGSQERICLSDGKWSGSEPRCVRDCGRSKTNKIPFIINGQSSEEGQWPWQAGIAWDEKLLMDKQIIDSSMVTSSGGDSRGIHCGGSLINEEWVLTAAHCVTKQDTTEKLPVEAISVYLGKQYRDTSKDDDYVQWSKIGDITVHEQYSPGIFKADIAMIRLEIFAKFSDRVVPVCLPSLHRPSPLEKREKGVVSGWGLNEEQQASDVLKYGIIEFVPPSECEQLTPGQSPTSASRVQEDQFCAKAISLDSGWTCRGDSGGPLVYIEGTTPTDQKWVIEGIVSWGRVGCAEQASVYIKVQYYITWMGNFVDVREHSG